MGVSSSKNITDISSSNNIMGDTRGFLCPPPYPVLSTSKRTDFGQHVCNIYGWPSSGGVLIKTADLVDMLYLSVPRFHTVERSPSAEEEDRFCSLMRRTGATWWASEYEWIKVQIGEREATEEEDKVLVLGWPADGVGVWVLRFRNEDQLPADFARLKYAMNMEEKIQMMKVFGAVFVQDATHLDELHES